MPRTVDVLGEPWPVRFTAPEKDPDLEGHQAYCDTEARRIVVDEDLAVGERVRALRHELTHAVIEVAGLELELMNLGLTADQADRVGELIAGSIVPLTLLALKKNRLLP